MSWKLETLGNATLVIHKNGNALLATDPWLVGTAYFGSWSLEEPPTEKQIQKVVSASFIWFSHGHPDHFHPESIDLISRRAQILVPDHYDNEMERMLISAGFKTCVLPFREWVALGDDARVMCLQNENMDAILAIELGDTLILNMNDSPFCGHGAFLRRLVGKYRTSYLLKLHSWDADMLNIVNEFDERIIGPPEEYRAGAVRAISRICDYLSPTYFCCSSAQHVYIRSDSKWANDYRTGWSDMATHWCAKSTNLVEPFVRIDLKSGKVIQNHPSRTTDLSHVTSRNGEDNWEERLSECEWSEVESFIGQFNILGQQQDFIAFTVGGETRKFFLSPRANLVPERRHKGIIFGVPRHSLLVTVRYGYFDDLLIGNFMRTQLINMTLYPHFSRTIAKLGGNAKVFTPLQRQQFRRHFFRLSPVAYVRHHAFEIWRFGINPALIKLIRKLGMYRTIRHLYYIVLGYRLEQT